MDTIQRSELVIAKILDLAMQKGIQDWSLSFENLGLGDEYAPHFYPCLEWLEAEDLIRVKSYHREMGRNPAGGVVQNPVLTSHGMNKLGHRVQIGSETIQISEAVHKVSAGERSFSQVGDFFGGFLGGFTKSLGS